MYSSSPKLGIPLSAPRGIGTKARGSDSSEPHLYLERKTGFEPATLSLARRCSTAEPLPLVTAMVPRERLELSRVAPPPPQDGVSAISPPRQWNRACEGAGEPSAFHPCALSLTCRTRSFYRLGHSQ